MKTALIFATAIPLLFGCVPAPEPLPLMSGYRDPADQCVRMGESGATNQFFDHTADLAACPFDYEGVGVFIAETGAVQVAEMQGHLIFTVNLG